MTITDLENKMDVYQFERAILSGVKIELSDIEKQKLRDLNSAKIEAQTKIKTVIRDKAAALNAVSDEGTKAKIKVELETLLSQAASLGIFYKRDERSVISPDELLSDNILRQDLETVKDTAIHLVLDAQRLRQDAQDKAKEADTLNIKISTQLSTSNPRENVITIQEQLQVKQKEAYDAEIAAEQAEEKAKNASLQLVLLRAYKQQEELDEKFLNELSETPSLARIRSVDASAAAEAVSAIQRFSRKSKRKSPRKSVKKSPRKSLRKSLRKSVKKSPRKQVRKQVRKSVRKSVKKSPRKQVRKSVRKSVKKSPRKQVRKSVKKSNRKPVRKSQRKSVKKSNRKPLRKSLRKSARRGGKGMKKSR
jgi:hypothetical protein